MKLQKNIIILLLLFSAASSHALQPEQILVIANSDIPESVKLAEYYCQKRTVPKANILSLSLGAKLNDSISRAAYDKKLAAPIRTALLSPKFTGEIRCLLTTYGVPFKVGNRPPLKDQKEKLQQLQTLTQQGKDMLKQLETSTHPEAIRQRDAINKKIK